ncbi:helix-turn-helix domain-containing protein [Streptosporangium sp. DT93]|uniref:helix-turn-helix domain-containing protein n=1 Tax=Streptosporangium sp. DT93 TaxID=3393428 RepID=UPI003CF92637
MTVAPARAALAHHLRELRALTGKSLKELERVTAASDSSLSRYFSGAACPPWSVVEALCRAAGRDADELREPWEAARRARLQRYYPSAREEAADPKASGGPPEAAEQETVEPRGREDPGSAREPGHPEGGKTPEAPEAPEGAGKPVEPGGPDGAAGRRRANPRRRRVVPILVTLLGVAGLAGGGYLWSGSGEERQTRRYCPWRYVVTDGDPAPVRIADRPGANRRHIPKTYLPEEVFYAAEPPAVRNEMMQTIHGWVTQGDWIQRAPGPCVTEAGRL